MILSKSIVEIVNLPRLIFNLGLTALIVIFPQTLLGSESRGLFFDAPTSLNQIEAFRNDARTGLEKLRKNARQEGFQGPLILLLEFQGNNNDYNLEFETALALSRTLEPLRNDGFRIVGLVTGQVRGHGVLPLLACSEILMSNQPGSLLGPVLPENVAADPTVLSEYKRSTLGRYSQAVIRRWLVPGLELVEKPQGQGQDPFQFGEKKDYPAGKPIVGLAQRMALNFNDAKRLGLVTGDPANRGADAIRILDLPPQTSKESSEKKLGKPVLISVQGQLSGAKISRLKRAFSRSRGAGKNLLILKLEGVHGGTPSQVYSMAQEIIESARGSEAIRTIVWFDKDCADTATFLALACSQIWMQEGSSLGRFREFLSQNPNSSEEIRDLTKSLLVERKLSGNDSELLSRAMVESGLRLRWARSSGGKSPWAVWDSANLAGEGGMDLGPMIKPSTPEEENRPLEMSAKIAMDPLGLAENAMDFEEMIQRLGLPQAPEKLGTEWLDAVADFLTQTSTQVILVILGMACLMIEAMKPGLSLPGVMASLCFILIFWSNSHIQGQIDWLAILIFLLGLILVVVEVFLIPGVGVVGLSGVLMILGGMALVAYGHWPQSAGEWLGFGQVMLPFVGSLFGSIILAGVAIQFLPRMPFFNNLVLIRKPEDLGDTTSAVGNSIGYLVGSIGVAQTDLRPSGTALILGDYLDVISEGEFISQGNRIEVLEANPLKIIVRPVNETQTQ